MTAKQFSDEEIAGYLYLISPDSKSGIIIRQLQARVKELEGKTESMQGWIDSLAEENQTLERERDEAREEASSWRERRYLAWETIPGSVSWTDFKTGNPLPWETSEVK